MLSPSYNYWSTNNTVTFSWEKFDADYPNLSFLYYELKTVGGPGKTIANINTTSTDLTFQEYAGIYEWSITVHYLLIINDECLRKFTQILSVIEA